MTYLSRRLREERQWSVGQLKITIRVDTSKFDRALDRLLRTFDLRTLDRIQSSRWGRGGMTDVRPLLDKIERVLAECDSGQLPHLADTDLAEAIRVSRESVDGPSPVHVEDQVFAAHQAQLGWRRWFGRRR